MSSGSGTRLEGTETIIHQDSDNGAASAKAGQGKHSMQLKEERKQSGNPNELNELGMKIFLDRYALKDMTRSTLAVGDLVIVCTDPKTGQREIGVIQALLPDNRARVELKDGVVMEFPIEHVNKPIETRPEQMMERVARGIAAIEGERASEWYDKFRWLLDGWKFVPAGRILTAAGSDQQLTFYNCFSRETPVHTRDGVVPIGALQGEHEVLSEGGVFRRATFHSYGKQWLWAVTLENGARIFATPDHQWVVAKPEGGTERVTTRELLGRQIPVNPRPKPARDSSFAAGVRHGVAFADSSVQKRGTANVELFVEEQSLSTALAGGHAYSAQATATSPATIPVAGFLRQFRQLPPPDAPPSYWYGFIVGLIAAGGYVDGRGQVIIPHHSREALEGIAAGLLQTGFVPGKIIATGEISPFDGSVKPCYRLTILKASVSPEDLLRDSHRRNFESSPAAGTATLKVVSVKPTDRFEEVFCCVEPETHTITIGHGYLTGQCYVIPSPKDSRRGIVDTLSQMMEIMSRGGGVGINVSSLRPRHSYVKGVNGRSSGAVSWGALYSFVTGQIEQGGSRRGALMLILDCWHPDVLEFISSKREMGKITNANISVGITDAFMEAIEKDLEWQLVFPDTSHPDYEQAWDGDLEKWRAAGRPVVVHKTVRARDVWRQIIESAWASAEPGIYFVDRANKMSNSWYYESGYLGCTNPCLTGDALVSTPQGWKRVDSIKEGDTIATILGRGKVETVEAHERAPVFKVTLSDGTTLRATAAHQFYAIPQQERADGKNANKRFDTIRLDQLRVGDYIRIAPALMPEKAVPGKPSSWPDREYGFLIGTLLGDGCYTESNLARHAVLSQSQRGLAEFMTDTLLAPSISAEKDIPLDYINTNREFLAGLLDGLWSANGKVNLKGAHPSLRFKTASEKLAQSVRRILLMFGIHGRIVKGSHSRPEIDGRSIRSARPFYEVIISGAGVKTFAEQIGITHPTKAEQLKQARLGFSLTGDTWLARIVSIEPAGEDAVYDLYEPESDTWITDGVVNRGCGEQPLPGFGVCNLGAINLSKFVRDGDVAWDDLARTVRYGVRFLDDVIDATPYFFEENYKQQKSERRVGLNTMGLAEMLIRLGLRYGSEEAAQFIDKLYRFIASQAYLASAEIAAEKGPFPLFDAEKFLQSGYMKSMPEEVREAVRQKGVRNVTLLTQAPNGCVAPDTLVFADGALRPIGTLGDPDGPQWQDVSFTTHSDSGAKAVNKFYVNGYHQTVEITTAGGFNLAATLQHRVRVIDADGNYEWKQMGELQPGDVLALARGGLGRAEATRLNAVSLRKRRSTLSLPETMTPELAELIGFYIGNGCLKDRRGLGIAVDACDMEVVGRLQELIGRIFNLDARVDDTGHNCLMVWAGSYSISRWMRINGFAGMDSSDARIPEMVLAGGAPTVAAFLRGLFESNGSIRKGIVTLVTSSERLAREAQIALLGLGIVSTRRALEPGQGRYGDGLRHEVRLLNGHEALRFRDLVGFVSRRKQELLAACEDESGRGDSIPSALLRRIYSESEGLPALIRQEIAGALRSGMTQEKWRSLVVAHRALGSLPSAALLDGRLFFDVVANINLSHSLTFDLSVPDANTYIANGIIAHNTIGTMVGTSTGIEPFYFWSYFRKSRLGQHEERVRVFEQWQAEHPDQPLPPYFVTAMDLTPEEHIRVQAAIQRWVDSSISKTCNTPENYTVEQIGQLYELMYRLGCKGGTVYRDKSRDVQVLNLKEEDKKRSEQAATAAQTAASESGAEKQPASQTTASDLKSQPKVRPRLYKRQGVTISKATPAGTAHITMNDDEEGHPFEVFIEIGKAGSDIKAMAEAMGRLMSLILRMASPVSPRERVEEIVNQITGIGGARSYGFGKGRVLSLPDAVGQALAERYQIEKVENGYLLKSEAKEVKLQSGVSADLCPSCGDAAFVRQEGCQICFACGYSEC